MKRNRASGGTPRMPTRPAWIVADAGPTGGGGRLAQAVVDCAEEAPSGTAGRSLKKQRSAAELARAVGRGEAGAAEELTPLIYGELRGIANHCLGKMPAAGSHTLHPTALVHEVYLKLVGGEDTDLRSQTHFLSVAALAMKQILIDHARAKGSGKRGGGWERVTLSDAPSAEEDELQLVELEAALTRLDQLDERAARVVRMRFYSGMTHESVAEVLGISERTVRNDWRMARAWLRTELCKGEGGTDR